MLKHLNFINMHHSFTNNKKKNIRYLSTAFSALSIVYTIHYKSNVDMDLLSLIFSKNNYFKMRLTQDEEMRYLKSLLKPEVNLKYTSGESFYNSSNYLHNIKNVNFDWTVAIPISPPPFSVRKAGANSFLFDDLHHYGSYNGHPELQKVVQERFQRDGLKIKKQNIVINTSVFEILDGIYSSLNLMPDDSILIPTPTFGYYVSQASKHQIKINFLKTSQESNWKIKPKDLDKALTQTRAKIFLFTNPVNPTGIVYNKEEIKKLAEVLKKHHTLVISDEIFKDVLLDDTQKPFSIGAIEGMENLTITLNGIGKSMGLTGLRISYGCVPDWLVERLPKPLCGLSKPSEKAAVSALQNSDENLKFLENASLGYKKKIKLIKKLVNSLDFDLNQKYNFKNYKPGYFARLYIEPKATNVILICFQGLKGKFYGTKKIETSLDLASYLVKTANVALVPGEASFIESEEMVLRIPIAAERLEEGFKEIRKALLEVNN